MFPAPKENGFFVWRWDNGGIFCNNAVKNAVESMHFAEIEMFEKNLVDNSEKSVIMIITIKTSITNMML